MAKTNLSPGQVLQFAFDPSTEGLKVAPTAGTLITEAFDYVELTNSTIGGEVVPTTVTYKTGGAAGTVVATLTLTYDSSANLETVTKS